MRAARGLACQLIELGRDAALQPVPIGGQAYAPLTSPECTQCLQNRLQPPVVPVALVDRFALDRNFHGTPVYELAST